MRNCDKKSRFTTSASRIQTQLGWRVMTGKLKPQRLKWHLHCLLDGKISGRVVTYPIAAPKVLIPYKLFVKT